MSDSLWPHGLYTVHGILQARILEWVAFPFSRASSQSRDGTQVSCIAGRFFPSWATREAQEYCSGQPIPSPADLPDPGIEPGSPALQADSLPTDSLPTSLKQVTCPLWCHLLAFSTEMIIHTLVLSSFRLLGRPGIWGQGRTLRGLSMVVGRTSHLFHGFSLSLQEQGLTATLPSLVS